MSHLDYQAVTFLKEHGIILLTFPPHCSHALQPCDVTLFGPFKRACGKSQNDWLHLHPGEIISIKHIAELSTGPFQEAVTPKNIIAGFKATWIFPFNRLAIDPSRFLPSFVTDRPDILFLYNSFYQNVIIFTVSTNTSRRNKQFIVVLQSFFFINGSCCKL